MISTRDLSELPGIDDLRQRMQQMAALVSVFGIDYGTCTFEFNPKWRRSQQLGSIDNGSGDELYVHFTRAGCCIIGFAHESIMSPYQKTPPELWPGVLSSVPQEFQSSINEPAFDIAATTFVVWRLASQDEWHTGDIEYPNRFDCDGSNDLLSRLLMSSAEFTEWLGEDFEVEVDEEIVASVFANQPLTDEQLLGLNPDAPLHSLKEAVKQRGYPLAGG